MQRDSLELSLETYKHKCEQQGKQIDFFNMEVSQLRNTAVQDASLQEFTHKFEQQKTKWTAIKVKQLLSEVIKAKELLTYEKTKIMQLKKDFEGYLLTISQTI